MQRKLKILVLIMTTAVVSFSQTIVWKEVKNMPIANRNTTAAICDNKIYVIGGFGSSAQKTNYMYNPQTDTWEAKANMPTGRSNLAVATVNNKIYAFGGDFWKTTNEVYDLVTNTWTALAPMPTGRQHIAGTVLNNKIHVIGGLAEGNFETQGWEGAQKLAVHEVYDPATNTWSTLAPLPSAHHNVTLNTVNGKIYAIGGNGDNESIWTSLTFVYVYDPSTNQWESKGDLNLPFIDNATSLGDYVYLLSADHPDANTSTISRYNVNTNSLEMCTAINYVSNEASFIALNNNLYVIGGATHNMATNHSKVFEGSIIPTSIEEDKAQLSTELILFQNYPNPFNQTTTIEFSIPKSGRYTLSIFNISGALVEVVAEKEYSTGLHKETFNAKELSSGIYYSQLTGDNTSTVRKIILLR